MIAGENQHADTLRKEKALPIEVVLCLLQRIWARKGEMILHLWLDNCGTVCYSNKALRKNNIAEWSSLVARRAHNPKVVWFKSHLRNQKRTAP